MKLEKDVDGVIDINLGKLVWGDVYECFVLFIVKVVIEFFEKLVGVNLDGKKILVVGVYGFLEVVL